ncbi:MAG TPA: anthranilate phosphoribosyltransferase [Polyangia bacterium]
MNDKAEAGLDVRTALGRLIERQDLSADEMASVVGRIMDGDGTPAQVGALLTALRMKGETVDEVVGAARAMRARMLTVATGAPDLVVLDTCGTGGDASGSVNVTTLASIILAAAGVRIAKHGNRALSSKAGSHDVIEALGIDPAPGPALAARSLAEAGLCFMFAPIYHAATKAVAGPRRELGFRTLFNMLGPLTNPAGVRFHVNGVFAKERCEFLARAHKALGARRALVIHGAGGLDEVAPRGPTHVAELSEDGRISTRDITPADFGLDDSDPAGLKGGDAQTNAEILRATLQGAPGAVRSSALMTAGLGLYATGAARDLKAAVATASAALDGGAALAVLEKLRVLTPFHPTTSR